MLILGCMVLGGQPANASGPEDTAAGKKTDENTENMEISSGQDDLDIQTQHRAEFSPTIHARPVLFSTSISIEQMELFGDYSIQSAAKRMPGVQSTRDGTFNIRGVGLNQFNVTVDGQRMASTGMGNRVIDPGGMATDLVRDLEIIRVVTPDMDAEGLGGVVNLRTFRPLKEGRHMNVNLGGGLNTRYYDHISPVNRASIYYADNPMENLYLSVNLHHQQENSAWETLGIGFDTEDFGNGPVDVLERVAPGLHTDERGSLGAGVQLTYQHSDRAIYHLRGTFAGDTRQQVRQRNIKTANNSWVDPETVTMGGFGTDIEIQDTETRRSMIQAGGEHLFDFAHLDYNIGWARTRIEKDDYRLPFLNTGNAYQIDMSDRFRPSMEFEENAPRRQNLALQPMRYVVNNHLDNNFSGNINFEIPHQLGSVKIGSSALARIKDANDEGAFSDRQYSVAGLTLSRFDENRPSSAELFDGDYEHPWLMDVDATRSFFHSTLPNMSLNRELYHRSSGIWNYRAVEQVYAGYGMATFELGMISLMAGLRVEHTEGSYDGRVVTYNRFNLYSATTDTSQSASYTNLFPNARISIQPSEQTGVHLAYSRTHQRPDYNYIAPFALITAQDTTIFKGNPDLDPMVSDNFDLFAEHSINQSTILSAGVFYKELSNFFTTSSQRIDIAQGDIPFFDSELFADDEPVIEGTERTYANSDRTATIYGVELSLQQNLVFLPGLLRNLGIYANYTWSQSEYEPRNREEELALPFQSPHVVNLALNYTQGRLATQVSYYYAAEVLRNYESDPALAPSIGDSEVYLDQYQDGWSELSASVRFRLSENFRLWADVSNLLNTEQKRYQHTRDYYPLEVDSRRGRGVRLGLNYSF